MPELAIYYLGAETGHENPLKTLSDQAYWLDSNQNILPLDEPITFNFEMVIESSIPHNSAFKNCFGRLLLREKMTSKHLVL